MIISEFEALKSIKPKPEAFWSNICRSIETKCELWLLIKADVLRDALKFRKSFWNRLSMKYISWTSFSLQWSLHFSCSCLLNSVTDFYRFHEAQRMGWVSQSLYSHQNLYKLLSWTWVKISMSDFLHWWKMSAQDSPAEPSSSALT